MDPVGALLPGLEEEADRLCSAWLPRVVDAENGGFRENWDEAWNPLPDPDRFLVFQSRLTWVAGSVGQFYPERAEACRAAAAHGVKNLRRRFWDKEHGGFWWKVGLDGSLLPGLDNVKITYGTVFGIYGLAGASRLTQDPEHLAFAEEAFLWFDEHCHDPEHGGYFEVTNRAGDPIQSERRKGTPPPFGAKEQNSQLHVLEAFTELARASAHPLVRERLAEMVEVIAVRMKGPLGSTYVHTTRDWQPLNDSLSPGHDIEAAFLVLDAMKVLGWDDPKLRASAQELADAALEHGWEPQWGGMFDSVGAPYKSWWPQAESLGALAVLHQEFGGPVYGEKFVQQWEFIDQHLSDKEHGGWRVYVNYDGTVRGRNTKSDPWQGAYHEVRGMFNSILAARSLA